MLSLIVAVSQNGVIGVNNQLPWHISNDLKRFKAITSGKTIIMGRKTFESLPFVLPNRKHIVVTNNCNLTTNHQDVVYKNDLQSVLTEYKNSAEEGFLIGGASLYKQGLPYCDKLYITTIEKDYIGDAILNIDYSKYKITYSSDRMYDELADVHYRFINYSI